MNKNLQKQIEVTAKLENKLEAQVKLQLAKENRKKYLTNFINKFNEEINNVIKLGGTFFEFNCSIYINQMSSSFLNNELICPIDGFNRNELLDIRKYFLNKGYNFEFRDSKNYKDGKILISWGKDKSE